MEASTIASVDPSPYRKVLVWLIALPLMVELDAATPARSMLSMSSEPRVSSSPPCVTASPFASCQILRSSQPVSFASMRRSPLLSSSARRAKPSIVGLPNSSVTSSMVPFALRSRTSRPSSAETQAVCSANPSPSISKTWWSPPR